jgi:hypothetical protein
MTPAQETMMSWARVISSFDEIPVPFKAAYLARVGSQECPPYTVFIPPQPAVRRKRPIERLVFDTGERIHILEHAGGQVTACSYSYSDIALLETGHILLYAWISINGATCSGSTLVEFNEVTRRYFIPFLQRMRPGEGWLADRGARARQPAFDRLGQASYKFMNYAYDSLYPGQQVIGCLYQPAIRQPRPGLLGRRFSRSIALAHLVILTGDELILVSEVERFAFNRQRKHGGAWQFIPLRSLRRAAVRETPQGLLSLELQITGGWQVTRLFEAEKRGEVEELVEAIQSRG